MKGVDIFNQACSYYHFPHRSWKWYRSIINWLMEIAIINSYKLYNHIYEKTYTALQFRQSIIKSWQRNTLKMERDKAEHGNSSEEVSEENFDSDNMDEEYTCRLAIFGNKGDLRYLL